MNRRSYSRCGRGFCGPAMHHGFVLGRAAFNLVELLVVLAIISLLMALLLPSVQMIRQSARAVQCKNNMHQWGIAYHHKSSVRNSPATWTRTLAPFIENQAPTLICPNHVEGMKRLKDNRVIMGEVLHNGQLNNPGMVVVNGAMVPQGMVNRFELLPSTPNDLRQDKFENETKVRCFKERSDYVLQRDVAVTFKEPGTYNKKTGAVGVIPKGTVVDCYMLHYDPVGQGGNYKGGGAITFEGEILGGMHRDNKYSQFHFLSDYDGEVGNPTSHYSYQELRGMEPGEDSITLSSDRRSLRIDYYHTPNQMEEVRVLVKPGPFSSYAMNGYVYTREVLLSHTVLMNEYYGKTIYFLQADLADPNYDDYMEDPSKTPYRHWGLMHVLFADGHVELLDPKVVFDPQADHWHTRMSYN